MRTQGAKTSASAIDSEINLNKDSPTRDSTPPHASLDDKPSAGAKEAEHIKAIGDKVLADGDHVDRVQELLRTIRQAAREGDQDDSWIAIHARCSASASVRP